MNLKDKLIEDMKQAMRSKDTVKLGMVRFLRSEIKNFEIDNGEQDDKGILKIIASQVKKMKDALAEFKTAGREEIVSEEEIKIKILESYLPEQLSDSELEEIVSKVVEAAKDKDGELSNKDMGRLIGIVVKKVDGKANGNRISVLVRQKLQ